MHQRLQQNGAGEVLPEELPRHHFVEALNMPLLRGGCALARSNANSALGGSAGPFVPIFSGVDGRLNVSVK
jgi:hypothetical protein